MPWDGPFNGGHRAGDCRHGARHKGRVEAFIGRGVTEPTRRAPLRGRTATPSPLLRGSLTGPAAAGGRPARQGPLMSRLFDRDPNGVAPLGPRAVVVADGRIAE